MANKGRLVIANFKASNALEALVSVQNDHSFTTEGVGQLRYHILTHPFATTVRRIEPPCVEHHCPPPKKNKPNASPPSRASTVLAAAALVPSLVPVSFSDLLSYFGLSVYLTLSVPQGSHPFRVSKSLNCASPPATFTVSLPLFAGQLLSLYPVLTFFPFPLSPSLSVSLILSLSPLLSLFIPRSPRPRPPATPIIRKNAPTARPHFHSSLSRTQAQKIFPKPPTFNRTTHGDSKAVKARNTGDLPETSLVHGDKGKRKIGLGLVTIPRSRRVSQVKRKFGLFEVGSTSGIGVETSAMECHSPQVTSVLEETMAPSSELKEKGLRPLVKGPAEVAHEGSPEVKGLDAIPLERTNGVAEEVRDLNMDLALV
ncbi:hypothetical protein F2P56_015715 [Juglans regia]|uniref:Uncharacterized protein n=1 Tax=Juglans regia TaxID=51240 RepID=A0A833XGQ1_JUGRE|nr:hypothetical protein F2P56_015715 [Juglans regia]